MTLVRSFLIIAVVIIGLILLGFLVAGCALRVESGVSIGPRDPPPAVADLAALVELLCTSEVMAPDVCTPEHRAALVRVLQRSRR